MTFQTLQVSHEIDLQIAAFELPVVHLKPQQAQLRANSLADLTATEFLVGFRQHRFTAYEYSEACADRIEQFNPQLRAFHRFDRDLLLRNAKKIDEKRRAGDDRGRMSGVPVGVKDVFNTYDYPTGMGSEILDNYAPGNDARVVSNIRLQGGLIAGKTVTAEFAVHHPGATVHPLDNTRTPGTSSSGSAAAVAAHMCPIALATQTAGSTIRPASYCGIIGWKPSFGLLPRTAMLKTTDTLDTVGIISRSIDDAELLFEVTRVRGHNYPNSDIPLNDAALQTVVARPWRVGLLEGPKSHFEAHRPRTGMARIVEQLANQGCEVIPLRLSSKFETAHYVHERMYRKALAYYFKHEWRSHPEMFSPTLREMIADGMTISTEEYANCLSSQKALVSELDQVFDRFDILVCLATADEAPVGLTSPDLPDHCLIFTMCGVSAMTLPLLAGSTGLPVGLQIVARKYSDYKLLSFARLLMEVVS